MTSFPILVDFFTQKSYMKFKMSKMSTFCSSNILLIYFNIFKKPADAADSL